MNIRVNLTRPRPIIEYNADRLQDCVVDHAYQDDWLCDDFYVDVRGGLRVDRGHKVVAVYPPGAWTRLIQTEDDFETVVA